MKQFSHLIIVFLALALSTAALADGEPVGVSSVTIDDIADVTYSSNLTVEVTYRVDHGFAEGVVVKNTNDVEITTGINTATAGKVIISGLNAGEYTICISNGGDESHSASSAEATFNVKKATIAIEPVLDSYDKCVAFTVPTDIDGSLDVTIDGESESTFMIINGECKIPSAYRPGVHTFIVTLTDDTNYEDACGQITFEIPTTVVTSAVSSAAFRLDTREGPFESGGTETIAYSSLWHGTQDSSVTILVNGEPLLDAQGLTGESNYVWKAVVNGTNVLSHVTTSSSAEPETAIFVVSGLNADLTAEIAWKLLEATGTYFAQLKVTCTNGLSAGVDDLKFMFADRVGADGKNEAALWSTPVRSANSNKATVGEKEYRFVALDPGLITAENTPVAYGVADMSASSIPVAERTIELYVRRRVSPQTGNESAANVDDFVGYVVWSSGGNELSLPVAAGAAGRALGAAGLATASPRTSLPSPKRLNAALAVGVLPEEDGEPYCRFSEFAVGGNTIRGKIEVGADGQAGALGANSRLVLLGGDSPGGELAELCAVEVGPDGSFAVPAPKDARFFRLALEIKEITK